jgi:hypothetical protein
MSGVGALQDVICVLLVQAGRLLRVMHRIKVKEASVWRAALYSLSAFGETISNNVFSQQLP